MSSSFNKQSQFELFPASGSGSRPVDSTKQRFFLRSLTLSLESLVVIGIVLVMSMVVSYSVGIEKGKTQTRAPVHRSVKKTVPQKSNPMVAPVAGSQSAEPAKLRATVPVAIPAGSQSVVTTSVRQSPPLILEKPQDPAVILAQDIEKSYTIQVASFKEVKYAEQEAGLLKRKGYDILILPKGGHSIVCVGKFSQKEQAKSFSQKLKKQYKDCLVRSL